MSNCRVCNAPTDAFLCRADLHALERAIGDMTSLLHEVSNVATGQTRVYRANGKPDDGQTEALAAEEHRQIPARLRSPHGRQTLIATRPMVNLPAREMLYEAYDTLLTWASTLGADPISSRNVVAWLLRHANDARHHEDAAQMYDEITYLHGQLEKFVDRSPSRIYAGPCHAPLDGETRCERDLYGWRTADHIECDGYRGDEQGCGAQHTVDDRREWFIAELDDALMPLDDLRRAMPRLFPDQPIPPEPTWRSWVFRNRLTPHGVANGGVPLYRGGDVFKLIGAWLHGDANRPGRRRDTRAS